MTSPLRDYFASLVALETDLWNAVDRRMTRSGALRLGRMEYLRTLRGADDSRIQDIALRLGTTVGATSKLTDRLGADGLVERVTHPTDRRSSFVRLTSSGLAALEAGEAAFEDAITAILGALDPAGIETARASLDVARSVVVEAEVAR